MLKKQRKCDACHTRKAEYKVKMEDEAEVHLCGVCRFHENKNTWISRNNAKVRG